MKVPSEYLPCPRCESAVCDCAEKLPHVTAILADCGLIDTEWFTPQCATRGSLVHLATQMIDERREGELVMPPEIAPYASAYRKFRAERPDIKIKEIELPVYSWTYGYQGRLDRIIGIDDGAAVMDVKSGAAFRWHALQVALYAIAAGVSRRFTLRLQNDGKYKFDECKDRTDRAAALAAVTIYNWKHRGA